jgi:uncharacterized membrane protein
VEARIYLWLHLLAFAAYAGATMTVAFSSLPAARAETDPKRRLQLLATAMRVYDPLSIAALGVLVMTGAFRLTAYKAALRAAFFDRVGIALAWKLFFTFLLINLGAYVAFGIGHRLVGMHARGDEIDPARLGAMEGRLQWSLVIGLVLVALIVWVALGIAPAALQPS